MKLSIPGKIFAGFLALLLTFTLVSGYTALKVHTLGEQIDTLHRNLVPLPVTMAEIRNDVSGLSRIVSERDPALLRRGVNVARRAYPFLERLERRFDKARDLVASEGLPKTIAPTIQALKMLDAARVDLASEVSAFFEAVERTEGIPEGQRALIDHLSEFQRSVRLFELRVSGALTQALAAFAAEEQRAVWSIVLLAAVALVVGIVIAVSAARILRPLGPLRAAVARLAQGAPTEPVPVDSHDELGALAADFNQLAEALQARDAQLAAQQAELLHQDRLATVGRMSAQITHELRNPLSSIGLNSELLMEELDLLGGADEARGLLASIIKEVERLRDITEEYLRFARLPRPEAIAVDLNHMGQELIEFCKSEMDQSGVKMRLDADRAARPALADPNQLRSAILNLTRNAREALEQHGGGHVTLRVRSLGTWATLEVIDDGPGLTEEARERLFEPFFSTKPQGTGLGLSMVQKIVLAQGGEVEVASGPTRGTRVKLKLPLGEDEPQWSAS
ncbi:MAG: sensor histidine kinase [Bradymonadia bacterium]